MTLYRWSRLASSDASADPTINWAEGQAPSSINDSARAMMAATAKYRDDIAGAIVTSGTSAAYEISSYQAFDSLAHLNGQAIAFTPHTTNSYGPVTLNVDGLGARPVRTAPNADLLAGTLVQGTPYVSLYNNAEGAFYLQSFFGPSPYLIPIGASLDYWSPYLPNSSFAFPYGQAISRTVYATLWSSIGTTYGAGDGSSTFNLPDKRGRVSVAADNMGGGQAGRINNVLGNALGAVGGEQMHALTVAEMPSHNHSASVSDPGHAHIYAQGTSFLGFLGSSQAILNGTVTANTSTASTGIDVSIGTQGGGSAHNNLQPSIVSNCIMRVI